MQLSRRSHGCSPAIERKRAVREFLLSRRRRFCRPRTMEFYDWCLSKLLGERLPAERADLDEVLGSDSLSETSNLTLLRGLKVFFRWTSKTYRMPNPLADDEELPRTGRHRRLPCYYTKSEVAHYWAACRLPIERAITRLLLDTGLRIGEAWRVTRHEAERGGVIRVDEEGKTGARDVPVSEAVRLQLLTLSFRNELWIGKRGPLQLRGLQRVVTRVARRANLPGGPHVLRHTFAVHYLLGGGDLVSLQRILGHSDIGTTRIYLELLGEDVKNQHQRFTPVNRLLTAA